MTDMHMTARTAGDEYDEEGTQRKKKNEYAEYDEGAAEVRAYEHYDYTYAA